MRTAVRPSPSDCARPSKPQPEPSAPLMSLLADLVAAEDAQKARSGAVGLIGLTEAGCDTLVGLLLAVVRQQRREKSSQVKASQERQERVIRGQAEGQAEVQAEGQAEGQAEASARGTAVGKELASHEAGIASSLSDEEVDTLVHIGSGGGQLALLGAAFGLSSVAICLDSIGDHLRALHNMT